MKQVKNFEVEQEVYVVEINFNYNHIVIEKGIVVYRDDDYFYDIDFGIRGVYEGCAENEIFATFEEAKKHCIDTIERSIKMTQKILEEMKVRVEK